MSNILVTGATGQVGSEIKKLSEQYVQFKFYFTASLDLNITDLAKVKEYCSKHSIDVIINCAAYTNVEKAEDAIEDCFAVNHVGTQNLAIVAKELNLKLVHISTDYVFDGTNSQAYLETDSTNPNNVYGASKLKGEQALKEINPLNSIIIRTSWVYSSFGSNFVKSMLQLAKTKKELKIVSDQVGTPTYAADLAKTILEIVPKIKNTSVEIYNYSNNGNCSWYDFAKEIFSQTATEIKVSPITTSEFPTKAKRPLFSILDKEKIKSTFGITIPHWKESLTQCLKNI
ncbi:dTDP-4-dehydrorhamnose reductase [Wenyingzhuangia sp. IMCC45574]